MNKTKVAVGIAAVFGVAATTGVVVVKKHASIPPSDSLKTHQQASTPSSATSEAAMDENGHKETAMDDNGHEKTGAAATPLPHRVYVPKADEPLAYRLFWQEVGERLTVEEMQSDPERAKETLRAIAEKHADGNADAETYFFLDAEWKLKEKSRRFISSDKYRLWLEAKKNLYGLDKSEDADLVHIYLSDRYASDTEKIDFYTKPLDDWVRWIRENAPSEWDAVEEAYSDNQWKFLDAEPGAIDGPPRYTYENFPTVEQRARAYYIAFFEAVALLPDDAAAFTVYFGSASPASEERHKIEDANPRQDAPPPPSPSKERQAASDEAAAVEAAFEQAVQDSIRRYGPEEGLRRLIVSDHDWIERIGRLQERRQEETPPPPED